MIASPIMYSPIPLPYFRPGPHATAELENGVREWVFSRPLRDLVTLFGGELRTTQTREALSWLDDFSRDAWDFRRGAERSAVGPVALEPGLGERILPAAEALGLIGRGRPSRRHYDSVLVLGGGALGCLIRTDFTAALVAQGLTTGTLAGLGSRRPLSPSEAALVDGAKTEGDAVDSGLRRAFGLVDEIADRRDVPVSPSLAAEVRHYRRAAIEIVVARRSEPGLRANTADTYAAWSAAAAPPPGDSLLIVTSEIYVPFQQCDAIRMLARPLNCTVETIGAPAAYSLRDGTRQEFGAPQYLQEVRSAIRSMRAILSAQYSETSGYCAPSVRKDPDLRSH